MNDVNKFKKNLYIRIFKKSKNVIFRDKYFLDLQNFFKLYTIIVNCDERLFKKL
jgi:hypothetical protein